MDQPIDKLMETNRLKEAINYDQQLVSTYPVFLDENFHYYQLEFLFSNTLVVKHVVNLAILN